MQCYCACTWLSALPLSQWALCLCIRVDHQIFRLPILHNLPGQCRDDTCLLSPTVRHRRSQGSICFRFRRGSTSSSTCSGGDWASRLQRERNHRVSHQFAVHVHMLICMLDSFCPTPSRLILASENPPALHALDYSLFSHDLTQLEEDEVTELEHTVYVSEWPWYQNIASSSPCIPYLRHVPYSNLRSNHRHLA